jgi:uncharacterized protein with HEPN domain
MRRDEATLLDIARCARLIEQFIQGFDRAAFLEDAKTQAAVLHQMVLIGEAAKRLSPEFRERHADIPWRDVCGMRDRVIHQYDRVDLDLVWEAAARETPRLLRLLEPLLPPSPLDADRP